MSRKPPPWINPKPPTAGPLIRGLLAVAVLFTLAFAVTRSNANAGIFLFLAVICYGLALVALFATGVQRFGAEILRENRRSERDLLGGGLLLIALLTPWTVAVPTLHWSEAFGWQTPPALLTIASMLLVYVRPWRRFSVAAVVLAALALVGWVGWLAFRAQTAPFAGTGFPFVPIDLLGDGWYFAALAFAVTVDGMAARASEGDEPALGREVWPFALVPGMGLRRLHYPLRARLWLVGMAAAVFLLQTTAVSGSEFQYYASLGSLPPTRPRTAVLIPMAIVLTVWLGSLIDTARGLRLEQMAEDSFRRTFRYRRPTVL
jgi:hypothetical protein